MTDSNSSEYGKSYTDANLDQSICCQHQRLAEASRSASTRRHRPWARWCGATLRDGPHRRGCRGRDAGRLRGEQDDEGAQGPVVPDLPWPRSPGKDGGSRVFSGRGSAWARRHSQGNSSRVTQVGSTSRASSTSTRRQSLSTVSSRTRWLAARSAMCPALVPSAVAGALRSSVGTDRHHTVSYGRGPEPGRQV
ncbi:MAG: hypothetical protein JWM79_3432 [Nocardioides sp.]|nr:hypothetical protein [Nocardioides sp.]